jgi:hypothetical protein
MIFGRFYKKYFLIPIDGWMILQKLSNRRPTAYAIFFFLNYGKIFWLHPLPREVINLQLSHRK